MKEQILAVQRMQDYIEKNNAEEINLSDLARVSLFSPWYSYRLFRDSLGLTPTEYIRKYRLTQAAKQLKRGNVKVIDAAFDAGFSNVDTFTRAFYREFGLYEKSRSCHLLYSLRCKISRTKKGGHRRVKHSTYFYTGYPQAGTPVHYQTR